MDNALDYDTEGDSEDQEDYQWQDDDDKLSDKILSASSNSVNIPTPKKKSLLLSQLTCLPTSQAKQLESELWSTRLVFPSLWQLDQIMGHKKGLPAQFAPHSFSKNESKLLATLWK